MSVFRTGSAFARLTLCLLLATCSTTLEAAARRADVLSVDLNPLIDRAAKSPARFAVDIPHSASLTTAGAWSTSGDLSTWTYSARIPGAVSMSFHASRALLPKGATLTVTASGARYVYTTDDARSGEIWSRIGRGDSLAFELKVAAKDATQVRLDISSLQAGYRGFGVGIPNHRRYNELRTQSLGMPLELASCTENWACNTTPTNEGPGEATAALIIGNVGQCSGVLLNNARGDGTPYVLTARHCENGSSDGGAPGAAANVTAYWNAVSPCGAPMGSIYDPGIPRQFGAQTVVEQQDAWLIRLKDPPIVDAHYAGWDATGATIVGGFTPHHAFGSSRQFIGWFGQAAYITTPIGSFESLHYKSTFWGTVNATGAGGGGSSGAGLFDASGRLVGTVVRGDETGDQVGVCPVPSPPAPSDSTATTLSTALSGIFNSTDDPVSTTGSVTLQSVLDPDHTGVQVLDGRMRNITVSVTANSENFPSGYLFDLQWSSTPGAKTCTASGGASGDGWSGALSGTSGTKKVTRYEEGDTTYTVTCTDGQTRTGSASITVHWKLSTPFVRMTITTPNEYGLPYTIMWDSNVAPCTASGGYPGDGWGGSVAPKGTQTVTETAVGTTLTFTVTCGSGTRVATGQLVTDVPPPYVELLADAATLRIDQPLYLTAVHRGSPCVKSGGAAGDGWAGNLAVDGYNPFLTATINGSTPGSYTYVLTCGSGAHVASAQATVTFTNDAPTASIQASAAIGTVNLNAITINWASNIRPCYVTFDGPQGPGAGVYTNGAPQGSVAVQTAVIGQYVYRVKCGSDTTVVEASTIVNWTGTPVVTVDGLAEAVRGSPFTLGYSSNILPCTTSGGVAGDGWAGHDFALNTYNYLSITEKDAGSPTFTVTCGSGAQATSASKTVTVHSAGPQITLTSDKEVQLTGQPITLTWSSNVTPCTLQGGRFGDSWTDTVVDPSGSTTVTGTVAGSYYYRISCGTGPVLSASTDTRVTYSDFPAPTLTANKTLSALRDAVTLTWASADGAECFADGGGYDDGWAGNRAASGSVDIKESSTVGYVFFYITCGKSPQVRVKVQFYEMPHVNLNSTTSTATVGDAVTLNWGSTNTETCTANGGAQGDGWTGTLSTNGSMAVRETAIGTYTYSVNCVGFANSTASANVTVTMNAPPAPLPPSSGNSGSSGGGGGALGPLDIGGSFAIALLAWWRRRVGVVRLR